MSVKKRYLIIGRSTPSAIFNPGESLSFPLKEGGYIEIFTRYSNEGYEEQIPREMVIRAEYEASDISEAVASIANTAQGILNRIEIGVNAFLGDFEIEIVLELLSGPGKREFFQSYISAISLESIPGRMIDLSAAREIAIKIESNSEKERLTRTIAHYHEALKNWSPRQALLCAEHLYMGVEALSKAALRIHMASMNIAAKELGEAWGYDPKRSMSLNKYLELEAVRRLIFDNDYECYKLAKDVSDGLEHGFQGLNILKNNALQMILPLANYLRKSILSYSGISEEALAQALSPKYLPRGKHKLIKYLWGSISSDSEHVEDVGKSYPYVKWETSIQRIYKNEKGIYTLVPNESITPIIRKEALLNLDRLELWDGSSISPGATPKLTSPEGG